MLKRIKQYKERHTQDFQMKESPPNSKKFINLDILKKLKIAYIPYNELLKEGFITGIGWAFGVTRRTSPNRRLNCGYYSRNSKPTFKKNSHITKIKNN